MLQLNGISKQYKTGELVQQALDGVSLNLRPNEFVSILGPSGSGKTTLLNVIGGLDRYDSGDLVINGVSTKAYKDRDWDAYRNHTIGFVFQSYNLIPHQSILANVELALTIGGVSKTERRARAQKALEEVGLGGQFHKRPNQMSGGQMQRVAIARALVNDPDILLADEPTGALDSETSVQVMELLKKVAEKRLVVMVTHNGELAQQYSTRIVRLRDGKIVDDSDPFSPEEATPPQPQRMGRARMSFGTALSLSFNNLRTKKGRTVLTAFAGSIGIIGIALILALSSGVNGYIDNIQRSTMSSYPITISARAVDMSGVMGTRGGMMGGQAERLTENRIGVYAGYDELERSEALAANIKENDLTAFKRYLDDSDSEIRQYLGENGVVYGYDVGFSVYSRDMDGGLVASDADVDEAGASTLSGETSAAAGGPMANMQQMSAMMGGSGGGTENFVQLMPAPDGGPVSPILRESYEILYGAWPEKYDEVILVLDENNAIPAGTLYQLGFITGEEYREITEQIKDGQEAEAHTWDYDAVCGHAFYLLPTCDLYRENGDGTFTRADGMVEIEPLLDSAVELRISGVIRPIEGAENADLSEAVAYTYLLTDYVIDHTGQSPVVLAQEQTPDVNVLNGLRFEAATDEEKVADAARYLSSLGVSDKAAMYGMILERQATGTQSDAGEHTQALSMPPSQQAAMEGRELGDETAMARALDLWLENSPDQEILLSAYRIYVEGASYAENMLNFGAASYDAPSSISIYTDSFEDKEAVSACIERYNEGVDEGEQITYTDYVALLTGSVSSIINVISYVLIAFVAVSLVVSSIMIGIITHISVMERTKEIGILRAMGASKGNISQVFNAETIIVGLLAVALGVGVSMLLTIPANSIIQNLLGSADLTAALPWPLALMLVALSMAITVVAGLIPARSAAKKDPVAALRTE